MRKKWIAMLLCIAMTLTLLAGCGSSSSSTAASGSVAGTYEGTGKGRNGDIVVAMVGDEATVKRFYRENGGYRLQPENPDMEPILCGPEDGVQVLGRVVSVQRFL